MTNFQIFSKAVEQRFAQLSKQELFVAGDGSVVADLYLAAFPEGTDPIFKTRSQHSCTCCRQFLKNIGNVVAIVNGKVVSVWDIENLPYPYDEVAKVLSNFVRAQPITSVFRVNEKKYGAEFTLQQQESGVHRFNHFCGNVTTHYSTSPGKAIGDINSTADVFRRGLNEFTEEAFDTVIDLINSNSLYRGAENLAAITKFKAMLLEFNALSDDDKDIFVWSKANDMANRFRNTAIGTLVTDISKDVDIESAVRAFESKVAPENYKRPTSLVTPGMIAAAVKTLQENDLESALHRRFAKFSDVNVVDVLWVDNSVQSKMKGGIEDLLMSHTVQAVVNTDKAIDISVEDFMKNVVPLATSMNLKLTNSYLPSLMSLTAPVSTDSGKLFAWNNDFGWSYAGNFADSIKERVKRAGGNVTNAKLRVSLAWSNGDDLDIHAYEPNGNHIYFGNKEGKLDVDMNAGGPRSRSPVENISWTLVRDGLYRIEVNQYNQRESIDVGFQLEVESGGILHQFSHKNAVKGLVKCIDLTIVNGVVNDIKVYNNIISQFISQEKWGVKTETFTKVNTLMLSPNHWGDQSVGNKHWFFVLDGCLNDEPTRGIYNEFLNPALIKHSKVFELLGNKTMCPPTTEQLSGVGFSSTKGAEVLLQVTGPKLRKIYNVKF